MSEQYMIQKSGDELVTDLLYLAEAINASMTFQEVLEAVTPILPDCQGVYLNLWENLDYETASYLEIAAAASIKESVGQRIGHRFKMTDFPFFNETRTERLMVVESTESDPRIDSLTRENYKALGALAYVRVTFQRDGRLLGALFFKYNHPRKFSERERRLALGIADLVLPAVERIHLQQETAQANEQMSLLYQLAESINAATIYQDVVESVAKLYPDANGILLNFFEHLDYEKATCINTMAVGAVSDEIRGRLKAQIPKIPVIEKLRQEQVWISENVFNDPRFDEESLEVYRDLPTQAILIVPLFARERLWGMLVFNYVHSRTFSEQERRLALAIGDLVISAVERIRLAQERAESNEELTFMYVLAESINAATSYEEIIDTVAALMPDCDGVHLHFWENFDCKSATYFEIVAASKAPDNLKFSVGDKFLKSDLPIVDLVCKNRIVVIEDKEKDYRVDPISFLSWHQMGVTACIWLSFYQGRRNIGGLFFNYTQPHYFSDRERRLAAGIGDLVRAAVERVRLLKETAAAVLAQRNAFLAEQEARQETSRLYQLSKAINQANDMDQVMASIKQLFQEPIEIAIFVWEHYDRTNATYLKALASSSAYLPIGTHLPEARTKGLMALQPMEALVASDLYCDELLDDPAYDNARERGIHAIADICLMEGQRVQGIFSIATRCPHSYTPQEIRLMHAIADLTAAALERFRSHQAEQIALQEREELFIASQGINAASTFSEILEAVMHIDFDDGDHYLYIFEHYDSRKATYIETVATSSNRFMIPGQRIPLQQLPYLLSNQYAGLKVYENIPENPDLDEVTRATLLSQGTRSNLRFGLVWHGRLLGAYGVDHPTPKKYSERHKRLLTVLGELISAAVERIRLQEQMLAARERAERLAEQAQQLAALEERTHLARELHDSVSQALYGIGLGAQTAQRYLDTDTELTRESVEYILTLAQAGLAEMRALIFELRPESLETEGLVIALAKQGASLQARHQINVRLDLGVEPSMPLAAKESLYRVLREGLHNVIKHANATEVVLRFFRTLCRIQSRMGAYWLKMPLFIAQLNLVDDMSYERLHELRKNQFYGCKPSMTSCGLR